MLAGFSLCVVAALAGGSGIGPVSASWAAAVSLFPWLSEHWVKVSLVLSPWVPMLAQALGDSVSSKSFGIGYRCVLQKNSEVSVSIPTIS